MNLRRRWLVFVGGLATAVLCVLTAGAGLLYRAADPGTLLSFDAVRQSYLPSEAYLLDRHGEQIHELRMDFSLRRLPWTPLLSISPALREAVVHAEDRRFFTHHGVDWRALVDSVIGRLAGRPMRGASTLSMQVAAQLDPQLTSQNGHRSMVQKLRQMRAALELERNWNKSQILEAYFNLVSFRGEWQGVATASQAFFDAAPSGITQQQALFMAALLPAPAASAAVIARRACAIGRSLASGADCPSLLLLTRESLEHSSHPPASSGWAPQLAHMLLKHPGERLRSTLDLHLQQYATETLSRLLGDLSERDVRDGAAVVVDNATGEVLAYVGSAGLGSHSSQVDGARALRQAGSTLKPFLYGLAIERRYLTAASLINDSPLNLETGNGQYIPQDYDHDFKGMVSTRTALASSLNVPAVRTLVLTGLEDFRDRLRDLGYVNGLTESGEYYGYSLALGSAEVSLLEQVNAYRTLANGGLYTPLRFTTNDVMEKPRRVMPPQPAFIIGNILSDRAARAVTFGMDNALSTRYWSAVKTGTSKDMRDNWCVGFSTRYTVGVWVGNFEGDSMHEVSGVTGAAPGWRDIMDYLNEHDSASAPIPPSGVIASQITFQSAAEPGRREWFIAGTELHTIVNAASGGISARLLTPSEGTIMALDPDIPKDRQHVPFQAQPAETDLRFELDGKVIATAENPFLWAPVSGNHRLRLIGPTGQALDSVSFQVRGMR